MWTDAEMLTALHLYYAEGLSARAVAERLGRSWNATRAMLSKVNRETDKHDLSPHLNGTMKADWWKEGLRNR